MTVEPGFVNSTFLDGLQVLQVRSKNGRPDRLERPFLCLGVERSLYDACVNNRKARCLKMPSCRLSGCLRPRKLRTGGRRAVSLFIAIVSRISRRANFSPVCKEIGRAHV